MTFDSNSFRRLVGVEFFCSFESIVRPLCDSHQLIHPMTWYIHILRLQDLLQLICTSMNCVPSQTFHIRHIFSSFINRIVLSCVKPRWLPRSMTRRTISRSQLSFLRWRTR